ncbi:MAG: class I SAM-dependent methyltransferase [Alphaproteobacteria bacterium]|nr:class I SAM-dependent methyltransferase [Alphaproteobacteria bacterium]
MTLDLESVRQHWDSKAAAWANHSDTLANMADRYNLPLLDSAGLQAGDRVLDLASGVGEPAFTEARLVGPEGTIVATDLAESMLVALKIRDKAKLLHLTAADMQRLPFADASFDRVICRFGIMFVPDPLKALRDVHRVLVPSGRAAFMVWGRRDEQTMFTILSDAVQAVTGTPPDDHHFQIFRFGDPGTLTSLFKAAGFRDITEDSHSFTPLAPLDMPFWHAPLEMTFGHIVDSLTVENQKRLEGEILRRLDSVREPNGYRLKARLHIVSGSYGK